MHALGHAAVADDTSPQITMIVSPEHGTHADEHAATSVDVHSLTATSGEKKPYKTDHSEVPSPFIMQNGLFWNRMMTDRKKMQRPVCQDLGW